MFAAVLASLTKQELGRQNENSTLFLAKAISFFILRYWWCQHNEVWLTEEMTPGGPLEREGCTQRADWSEPQWSTARGSSEPLYREPQMWESHVWKQIPHLKDCSKRSQEQKLCAGEVATHTEIFFCPELHVHVCSDWDRWWMHKLHLLVWKNLLSCSLWPSTVPGQ